MSRRYRALAQRFGISIRRQRGDLFVSSSNTILRLLRELSQHYRLDKQVYRWSWQPALEPFLLQAGRIGAGSTYLRLDQGQWEQRLDFLQSRILDLCFEICSDPEVAFVGAINLGVHLRIPDQHPLLDLPGTERFVGARAYPLKSPALSLPSELTAQLLQEGLQLAAAAQLDNGLALELRPGPGTGPACLPLPYPLEAGWRIPTLLDDMVFSPTGLEQCVAPLHVARG